MAMQRKLTLLVLLILAGVFSGCMESRLPEITQTEEFSDRIAFFSDREGLLGDIFVLDPFSGDITIISIDIVNNTKVNSLFWSETIQKWAFSGVTNDSAEIYLSSFNGKEITNITNTHGIFEDEPTISADGKLIAFTTQESGFRTAVFYSLVDGTDLVPISKTPLSESNPLWKDGSEQLLVVSSQEGTPNIFLYTLKDKNFKNISKGQGLDGEPSFDKEGDKLAFMSDRAGMTNIFLYNFDTEELTQLTHDMGYCSSPKISPDGLQVVFRCKDENRLDLYLLALDNLSIKQLTNTPESVELGLSWSPDSKYILFTSELDGQLDLFMIEQDLEIKNITNHPGNDFGSMWIRVRNSESN